MCGRYSNTLPPEAIRGLVRDLAGGLNFPPAYNAAPTQRLPVVVFGEQGPKLAMLRWGLIPSWSDGNPKFSTINARAETIDTKPAFRDAFRRRRCLVPADGFYEWRTEGGKKMPYRFTLSDGGLFAMAGVWDHWKPRAGQQGEPVDSFTVIVGEPNELVRPIHDRMPVILSPEDWAAWLDPANPNPKALLRHFPADQMRAYRVSHRVNSVKNDDASLLEPV